MSKPPWRPSISVVVPTLNRRDDLLALCADLRAQTVRPGELVVVDAGQVADMEAAMRAALEGSGIALVYRRSAAGTSLQRNIALGLVQGEVLFFFDDDLLIAPDFIERALEVFQTESVPPVGGVLATFDQPPRPQGWQQRWFKLFGMTRATASDDPADPPRMSRAGGVVWVGEPRGPVRVPVASGGRTAFLRAAIGDERFDEFLPGYTLNEDVEFSFRIAKTWAIVQSPAVRCYHKRSDEGRIDYGDRLSRLVYANFYFFRKHRPKDLPHLAAFAWNNLGIAAFYVGVGTLRAPAGQRRRVLRGLREGYARVWADLRPRRG
jgi:GT2 family glycosyltransferase